MGDTVQPDGWVALRLPNENLRVLQVTPNTTISLGKYGSFPSNLIIDRPFHLTYEVQEKGAGESFSRLRVVSGAELNADLVLEDGDGTTTEGGDDSPSPLGSGKQDAAEQAGGLAAQSNRRVVDDSARQTLSALEIEQLKRSGASAGKELIAKLMLSHTAIDQKTTYSLAKYKLLKERKFLRRFTVLPLDVMLLARWMLEDRDAAKILEMRPEMMALVAAWSDAHFTSPSIPDAGEDEKEEANGDADELDASSSSPSSPLPQAHGGRWLVVDDTAGLLVAAIADRMGILYPTDENLQFCGEESEHEGQGSALDDDDDLDGATTKRIRSTDLSCRTPRRQADKRRSLDYASTNTITLVHANAQPNLSLLRYFGYDASDPNPSSPRRHPLAAHLVPVSWLQLVSPEEDAGYGDRPTEVMAEELASWKPNRRGNYHRKRRRWARTRQAVESARAGAFSGLAVATTMDPVSVLRRLLPLLAGGSPIAIYAPNMEPLARLADCFSIARRTAWVTSPPPTAQSQTQAELEFWAGSPEFPINPSLVIGASVQTSRARRWQVLPGRTHPFMMARGGAEGFLFTGWRAVAPQDKISARGKYHKKKTGG